MRIVFIQNLLSGPAPFVPVIPHHKNYAGQYTRAQMNSLIEVQRAAYRRNQKIDRERFLAVRYERQKAREWRLEVFRRQQLLTQNALLTTLMCEV